MNPVDHAFERLVPAPIWLGVGIVLTIILIGLGILMTVWTLRDERDVEKHLRNLKP